MRIVRKSFIILLLLMLASTAYSREISVISNRAFPKNELSISQLKDIYSGDMSIIESVKIRPMDQKEPEIHKKFLEKVIGSSVNAYRQYWVKRIFQEGGRPPAFKESYSEVISSIIEDKGAIGYVWKEDAAGKEGIKVLINFEVGD